MSGLLCNDFKVLEGVCNFLSFWDQSANGGKFKGSLCNFSFYLFVKMRSNPPAPTPHPAPSPLPPLPMLILFYFGTSHSFISHQQESLK